MLNCHYRKGAAGAALALLAHVLPHTAAAAGPVYDGLGNLQEQDIQAAPPVAGAGVAFEFQQTYLNILGLAPRPPLENVIHWPRGAVWNGALFPQCDPVLLRTEGPVACPANSHFLDGAATAVVGVQAVKIQATVTGFVGTPQDGHPTQVFYVVPTVGPSFVLVGVLIDEPEGPYGLAEHLDLRSMPGATALTPSPIVITSFHSVDLHTYVSRSVNGQPSLVPLSVAPKECSGYWYYAIDNHYLLGPSMRSESRQACAPAR
jgi:hypothetical protein